VTNYHNGGRLWNQEPQQPTLSVQFAVPGSPLCPSIPPLQSDAVIGQVTAVTDPKTLDKLRSYCDRLCCRS